MRWQPLSSDMRVITLRDSITGLPHGRTRFFIEGIEELMRSCFLCTSLTICFTLLMGCGDDNPVKPEDPSPKILDVHVPSNLWTETETAPFVSVTVSDPQGLADIESVTVTILKTDSLTTALFTTLNDSARNGDLIAFDGIYSREISTTFIDSQPGKYFFVFRATDQGGHGSDPVSEIVPASEGTMNEPPDNLDIVLPDIVSVDPSIQYAFNVRVHDPQGMSDVVHVIFRIHSHENPTVTHKDTLYDDGTSPDAASQDGIFTSTFTSEFADSVVGTYPFSFQAFDRRGDSTDYMRHDVNVINEANAPPHIFNLSVPDTFDSGSATNNFLITLEVVDPQGLADIDSVHFTSLKPDGTWANNGLPIPLFDNGSYGDVVPGDGIYSFRVIFDPTAQKGDYTWTFNAVDRSGAKSNTIVHILTII